MTVKSISETRKPDGDFYIDFQNPYLDNTNIMYTKARVKSKTEGFVNTNAIGDLFMGSCLHCLLQNFVDRVPRHVKFNKLSGTVTNIENPDEEIIEFHVEVSVDNEYEADLDKVIKHLNENGCGMIRLLRKTEMFKVVLDIRRYNPPSITLSSVHSIRIFMVELVQLQAVAYVAQIVGVVGTLTAAFIAVSNYIAANKRAEEAKKKEQDTRDRELETRQAQLFMQVYNRWDNTYIEAFWHVVDAKFDTAEELWELRNKDEKLWSEIALLGIL